MYQRRSDLTRYITVTLRYMAEMADEVLFLLKILCNKMITNSSLDCTGGIDLKCPREKVILKDRQWVGWVFFKSCEQWKLGWVANTSSIYPTNGLGHDIEHFIPALISSRQLISLPQAQHEPIRPSLIVFYYFKTDNARLMGGCLMGITC